MLALLIPVGHDPPVLHRHRRPPVDDDPPFDHQVGFFAGGCVVALLLYKVGSQIRAQVFVDQVDLIIDGGEAPGIGSTVIDLTTTPPMVVRPGMIEISRGEL